jgi:hypothetical protein
MVLLQPHLNVKHANSKINQAVLSLKRVAGILEHALLVSTNCNLSVFSPLAAIGIRLRLNV